MTYKDLLVHLDDSKGCGKRVDAAVRLAEQHDAHLTGVYPIVEIPLLHYIRRHIPRDVQASMDAEAQRRAETALESVRAAAERGGVDRTRACRRSRRFSVSTWTIWSPISSRLTKNELQMRLLRLLYLLPFFWACSSIAQQLPGDPLAGGKLAREVCAACHIVADDQLVDPDVGAPTFFEVIDDPSVSELSLRAFLQTSHATMPNLILTPDETDDIIAYLLTLKGVQQ